MSDGADLDTLRARLAALNAQRATGVASVRFADGKAVTYRTDAEIARAIADLERQIAAAQPRPRARFGVAGFCRD